MALHKMKRLPKPVSHEPALSNDIFWERFLTETPQSDGKREKQESKEDVKIGVDCNWFNHRGNVDPMGHLASAEKA